MPKNKDLINEINIVATEKGIDVPITDGKSNVELVGILKGLKTPPPPPGNTTDQDTTDQDTTDQDTTDQDTTDQGTGDADTTKATEQDADVKPAFEYSVAPGVSITAKGARILADGDEITTKDIPAGSFEAFLKSGKIVKG